MKIFFNLLILNGFTKNCPNHWRIILKFILGTPQQITDVAADLSGF